MAQETRDGRGVMPSADALPCVTLVGAMNVLFRSIITGFGLRIGAEIAKKVSKRMFADGSDDDDGENEESRAAGTDDDDLPGITPDPPEV